MSRGARRYHNYAIRVASGLNGIEWISTRWFRFDEERCSHPIQRPTSASTQSHWKTSRISTGLTTTAGKIWEKGEKSSHDKRQTHLTKFSQKEIHFQQWHQSSWRRGESRFIIWCISRCRCEKSKYIERTWLTWYGVLLHSERKKNGIIARGAQFKVTRGRQGGIILRLMIGLFNDNAACGRVIWVECDIWYWTDVDSWLIRSRRFTQINKCKLGDAISTESLPAAMRIVSFSRKLRLTHARTI